MVSSEDGKQERETPGSGETDPGAGNRGTEGSQHYGEVVFVIVLTMEQLRIAGPVALRPWLERRMRTLRRGPGTVVEFHQETFGRGET